MHTEHCIGPVDGRQHTIKSESQPFPTQGLLAHHCDLALADLHRRHGKQDALAYCYVLRTIHNTGGIFEQRGSAPNWQGGLITLCTCKHHMRTFSEFLTRRGTWIAGFCGVKAGEGRCALVYLMKVAQTCESQYDLWRALSPDVRSTKAVHLMGNALGDLYKPRRRLQDEERFDPNNFIPPCDDHSHMKHQEWHKDIDYEYRGRRPSLLVGDPAHSYLWKHPRLYFEGNIGRGQRKLALAELLSHLSGS